MPVITALGRDDPLKVCIFLSMFRQLLLLTRFGLVRSLDLLGRKHRKLDTDRSISPGLVSSAYRPRRADGGRSPSSGLSSLVSCANL